MKQPRWLVAAAILAFTAACEPAEEPADDLDTAADAPAAEAPTPTADSALEPGTLAPVNRSGVRGTAELEREDDEVEVTLEVEGLEAGQSYPAHVHAGRCAAGGPVELDLGQLEAGDDGTASIERELEAPDLAADAELFIQVHGPDGQPIACADMAGGDDGASPSMGS